MISCPAIGVVGAAAAGVGAVASRNLVAVASRILVAVSPAWNEMCRHHELVEMNPPPLVDADCEIVANENCNFLSSLVAVDSNNCRIVFFVIAIVVALFARAHVVETVAVVCAVASCDVCPSVVFDRARVQLSSRDRTPQGRRSRLPRANLSHHISHKSIVVRDSDLHSPLGLCATPHDSRSESGNGRTRPAETRAKEASIVL